MSGSALSERVATDVATPASRRLGGIAQVVAALRVRIRVLAPVVIGRERIGRSR